MLPLLRNRRSIRKFEPRPIEEEKVGLLTEALLRSPSSRGLQPWEFIVVSDPGLLKQLATAKEHGCAFLKDAAMAVVVGADPEQCDVWVEDCAVASTILQLTASDLGLGSCWVQIRKRLHGDGSSAEGFVRQLLDLPQAFRVATIIGIGYAAESKEGHPVEVLPAHKVHRNRYRQSSPD